MCYKGGSGASRSIASSEEVYTRLAGSNTSSCTGWLGLYCGCSQLHQESQALYTKQEYRAVHITCLMQTHPFRHVGQQQSKKYCSRSNLCRSDFAIRAKWGPEPMTQGKACCVIDVPTMHNHMKGIWLCTLPYLLDWTLCECVMT